MKLPVYLFFGLIAFQIYASGAPSSTFSIMTYNVENLFDDHDDLGVEDETYLPKSQKQSREHKAKCELLKSKKFKNDCLHLNWNSDVIKKKMRNLSQQILSVDSGRGPDVLILVEIENKNILDQFNRQFLSDAGYKTIELIEGEDTRGIDVAILSRFTVAEKPKLLSLDIFDSRNNRRLKTRGVLRVPMNITSSLVVNIFAVHLPSQGSPTSARTQGLQNLISYLKEESKPWIVGGDFNITQQEDQQSQLIEKYLLEHGSISHLIGCRQCQGTHNFKGSWSYLDMLYFDKRLPSHGVSVDAGSIEVIHIENATDKRGKPKRFTPAKGQGASDHFPLYARLKVDKKIH